MVELLVVLLPDAPGTTVVRSVVVFVLVFVDGPGTTVVVCVAGPGTIVVSCVLTGVVGCSTVVSQPAKPTTAIAISAGMQYPSFFIMVSFAILLLRAFNPNLNVRLAKRAQNGYFCGSD